MGRPSDVVTPEKLALYEKLPMPPAVQELNAVRPLARYVSTAYSCGCYSPEDVVRLGDVATPAGLRAQVGFTTALADCVAIATVCARGGDGVFKNRRMAHLRGGAYEPQHLDDLFGRLAGDYAVTVAFGSSWIPHGPEADRYLEKLRQSLGERKNLLSNAKVFYTRTAPAGQLPSTLVLLPNGVSTQARAA